MTGGTRRHESQGERADGNLQDLLQEVGVAAIGVQVLFGFLQSIPITACFRLLARRTSADRDGAGPAFPLVRIQVEVGARPVVSRSRPRPALDVSCSGGSGHTSAWSRSHPAPADQRTGTADRRRTGSWSAGAAWTEQTSAGL